MPMSPNVPDTNATNDAASREPCPNCGYDLRATTVGARCPECGTKRITVARSQVQDLAREADAARDRLEDGWRLWARTLLISPLIVFGLMGSCLGPALLVAFAFVAPFRLIALRKMTPRDPYAQRLRSMDIDLARARKFAVIECGIAIAVVIIAILRSLPSAFISHEFYLGVALLCAIWQCVTLLNAHQLARSTPPLLVEASRLPTSSHAWIWFPCTISIMLYCLTAGAIVVGVQMQSDAFLVIGSSFWFLAAVSMCIAAVWSRAHASLVCDCLFESQLFNARRTPDSFFNADNASTPRRIPPPKPPEDDTPIPLAD